MMALKEKSESRYVNTLTGTYFSAPGNSSTIGMVFPRSLCMYFTYILTYASECNMRFKTYRMIQRNRQYVSLLHFRESLFHSTPHFSFFC